MVFDNNENSESGNVTQRMLERLCSQYWYPVYAYLRKKGYSSHDAQDLIQGFFSKMLEGNGLAQASQERGRFRSYLIGAVNHYLSDQRKRERAEKRGGGRIPISIDQEQAEDRFKSEPVDHLTPEHVFDREWALALLQEVVDRLEKEYAAQKKERFFDVLGEFLTAKPEKGTYPVLAKELGVSEGNVRVMVNRLRKRYQELLREVIAETVGTSGDAEQEWQHLFRVFSA